LSRRLRSKTQEWLKFMDGLWPGHGSHE